MKESVLHYIWQYKLFEQHNLRTSEGEALEIIDIGKPNPNAGPDFFNAKIKIGKTIWAGNVEIHTCSSDWNRHRHQTDPAYNNVILHVVKLIDVPVLLQDGEKVPQLELRYNEKIEQNYTALLANKQWIPCGDRLHQFPEFEMIQWQTALLMERMSMKVHDIDVHLAGNNNFWEETMFCQLCRGFGGNVNGDAFYTLGKSIPWIVLQKHRHDLLRLEALLFGQSGLLNKVKSEDTYINDLKREYAFMSKKYCLKMMSADLWRLLRLRPDNFPQIRIAQLAWLIHRNETLFSKITKMSELDALIELFSSIHTSQYWTTHYQFGVESLKREKNAGLSFVHQIIINAVLPIVCCYAEYRNNQEQKGKAIALLEELPPENNYITRKWSELGVSINTAADSQSFIHLYKHYCEEKKCLRCRIGYKLLTSASNI